MPLLFVAAFVIDLLSGSIGLSPKEIFYALMGKASSEQVRTIVIDIRLTKALTALWAGAAISVSGLLMQTLFRNPLAGPYVLGVSSGASLGAAISVLSSAGVGFSLLTDLGTAGAAWIGCAAILAIISAAGRRIKDIMVILILGMMLGSGIDAIVQILQYLSDESSLKSFVIWTMGSLGSVTGNQLILLTVSVIAGLFLAFACSKPLNLLLMGEQYASSMGTSVKTVRNIIYLATILLAGTVTAFCGPLGFIGLAVPHLTRFLLSNADHRYLIPATILTGSTVMMLCDTISKLTALPVNAITSFIGIPVVVWVVINNKKL